MKSLIFSVLVTAKINFVFLLFWLPSNLGGRRERTCLPSPNVNRAFEKEEKEKKKPKENLDSVMEKHLIVQLTEGN